MGFDGGCLCGSVRYSAREDFGGGHCHCLDCRRTSGTGHGSHMIVAEDGFQLQGVVKGFSKPADSGNLVTRYFCPECGSAIYSRNAAMPGLVFLRASSLDDPEVFLWFLGQMVELMIQSAGLASAIRDLKDEALAPIRHGLKRAGAEALAVSQKAGRVRPDLSVEDTRVLALMLGAPSRTVGAADRDQLSRRALELVLDAVRPQAGQETSPQGRAA